jgi:hypothetical protein
MGPCLTAAISNYLNSLLPSMREFLDTSNSLESETRRKLDSISSQIQEIVSDRRWSEGESDSFSTLSTCLMKLVDEAQNSRKLHRFLESLHFKQIKERQFEVKTAHINTFGWIFKDESLKFLEWLRTPNDIFWIGGKAGSGKSTLMKFLCEHHLTEALLSKWARQQSFVIASHFFWSAGTAIQKSQNGLLRALLFQILVRAPNLTPLVCPNHWNDDSPVSLYSWSLPDLFQAFETLAQMDQLPAKFCLFIDGFDEYDGDHAEIIRIINLLAQSPHIKLCVSSRPWTVFVDAFDKIHWKLYLQDLTRNDIRLYIKDNLEEDPRFLELKRRETMASDHLVLQIIEKAQGVFLWVYLVVRSILRGLTNSDDISDLEVRLAELPGHLETYFQHMLNTIEDVYRLQTARTFRIMACAGSNLPLMALYFIDQERKDPNYALRLGLQPVSPAELAEIVRTKSRQLNARCKDLLEVTQDSKQPPFFQHRVGFLHRTVIDFLNTNDMAILMSTRAGPDFNPNVSLCRSYLAQLKALPGECRLQPAILRYFVFASLQHAKDLEISRGSTEVELLDDLDRTVATILKRNAAANFWNGLGQVLENPQIRHREPTSLVKHHAQQTANNLCGSIIPEGDCDSFLAIAVRSGLHIYVELKVREHCATPSWLHQMRLLSHALKSGIYLSNNSGSEIRSNYMIDLSMLRLLLKLGASPEWRSPGSKTTVWLEFLLHCLAACSQQRNNGWNMYKFVDPDHQVAPLLSNTLKACERLLKYGAGVRNASQSFDCFDLVLPEGMDIIRECFTDMEAHRLESVYRTIRELAHRKKEIRKDSTWQRLRNIF